MKNTLLELIDLVERLRLQNARLNTFIYSLPEMDGFSIDSISLEPDIQQAIQAPAAAIRAQLRADVDLHLILEGLLKDPVWPGKLN